MAERTDGGRAGGELLTERSGLRILRQLSPETLGVPPADPITTPEGFIIRGQTPTTVIRGLTELTLLQPDGSLAPSPTPIATLEETLVQPGTLVETLAADNERVLGLGTGITHQQLADFLLYFNDTRAYQEREGIQDVQGYEFNGRTFVHNIEARRIRRPDSPFPGDEGSGISETLTCLDDGSSIRWGSRQPTMIFRYGFYGSPGAPNRLDPESIAQVAGFIRLPEDDPVARLVIDPEAQVEITSNDQLTRIQNLRQVEEEEARKDLLSYPGATILPSDIPMLLQALAQISDGNNEIAQRIDTSQIEPGTLTLAGDSIHRLIHTIPTQYPALKEVIIDGVSAVAFPERDTYPPKTFVTSIIETIIKPREDNTDTVDQAYLQDLLRKLPLSPATTQLVANAANDLYRMNSRYDLDPEDRKKEKAAYAKQVAIVIDNAFPGFRNDYLAMAQEQGLPVDEGMNTAALIALS